MKLEIQAGQKFNLLTVLREDGRIYQPSGQWQRAFIVRCDCGTEKRLRISHFTTGRVRSCGCEAGEDHGQSATRLYNTWRGMKNRCHRPSYSEWHLYGGRGIEVCPEWRDSFTAFRDWANKNGFSEGLEIDRIDNEVGYCPANCRFVTPLENHQNRRVTQYIYYKGEKRALSEVLRAAGLMDHYAAVEGRIKRGWDHAAAIDTPIRRGGYRRAQKQNLKAADNAMGVPA